MFGKNKEKMDWKEFSFPGRAGGPTLRGRINLSSSISEKSPVILMLTGDGPKGTKSGSWRNLPPLLLKQGFRSFLFDFEGLGSSDGERRLLSLSIARANLISAFEYLTCEIVGQSTSIGAIAASFGASALLSAPEIANKLITIAFKSPAPFLPEAYLNEIGIEEFRSWVKSGHSQTTGYDVEVLFDAYNYNLWNLAREIATPCLITHGVDDEIVPFSHSELLRSCLAGETTLVPFHGVSHNYSEPGAWDKMAKTQISWLKDTLQKPPHGS